MADSSPLVLDSESSIETASLSFADRVQSLLMRWWFVALLLAVWQVASSTRLLDPLFFPAPSMLFATCVAMFRSGDFAPRILDTLIRTAAGFLPGAIAGIVVGIAMGALDSVRRSLEPLITALYNIPKLTLLPMLMLLAGTGETPRLILISSVAFLQVAIHTLDGVRGISPHYVEMASHYGANRWLMFRRVYLPASSPQVFTGLRLGIGRSLGIAISSELLTGAGGLGGLVMRSWQSFAIEKLYVTVMIAAVLGALIHTVLRAMEHRLLPWKAERT
jgi:ABC-type nitrate/sulfonate/bicarbonate transport system permease component